ncbi:MAG: FadR/GntR family transcriptional regulator [Aquincola tertiaricarbonis]|uniref:FadR/GntR family transcriptional regulator n=1 Tax=Aquincola sp. J276 TaxID=2898432 RepID=UPI002151D67A|nr:GntR family transcriptional regulator [Aquincola sp. J276]MCR5866354.1 GntR family transcriptional regulator [Aquincola sp. J276]
MPLQSIEPRRLYRQIADQLRGLIEAGEFAPGSRLPAERELAVQLGVSRPSVREALIALEVEGVIEVRMGSGIYVRPREAMAAAPAAGVEGEGPLETIRARQLVEGELAAAAAVAAGRDAALVAGLREAVALMEADIDAGVMPLRGDRLFHLRVAEASENSPLLRVVTELFDERNKPLFERLGSHFENEANWRAAVEEHRRVVEAIAAGDAAAAREAMRAHLQLSHDRFIANWPSTAPALVPPAEAPRR